MKITVEDFINEFKEKKVMNTKIEPDGVEKFIRAKLNIKTYVPFVEKREIVEMVVAQNLQDEDGVKRYDSIGSYMSFVVAMLASHTDFEISKNPIDDYDELSKNGLLELVIGMFKKDYDESEVLLKMTIAAKLEDNNLNILVGKFSNKVLEKIDVVVDVLKDKISKVKLKDIMGADIKKEDIAKLIGALDKLK